MNPGDGIKKVREVLGSDLLRSLLHPCGDDGEDWTAVSIEQIPHIERLSFELHNLLITLNAIRECEATAYHPHSRPSATYVLSGQAEMGIGGGSHGTVECARMLLDAGSFYEMLEPLAWHFLRPLTPVLTLTVKWEPYHPAPYVYSKPPRYRCTHERRRELLQQFRSALQFTFGERYTWQSSELEGDEG